ncbi:cobaltochelatase CobN subunit [Cupriavidus plantarum]|uniref:Cobaltochelatase CobN subunit n=2 Tax=Cupriavidus plantarum TaxID=942865 RepID=A0A316EW15_9BURK|nr:cobaltochelatase CobN subunit [Cupriavidus plantarum]
MPRASLPPRSVPVSALRQARAIPLAAFSPLLALVLCLLIVVTNTSFAAPVRILVITPNTHLLPAAEAAFRAKYAHAEAIAEIEFSATASDPAQIARADVIQTWYVPSAMQRAIAPAMRAAHARGALLLATPTPDAEAAWGVRVDAARNDAARQYWEAGGADNVAGFFAYASAQRGAAIDVPAVRPAPAAGIYHPRATRPFESLDAYLAWYRDQGRPEGGMPADAPLVALAFYATNYRQRDLAHIDTLIAALERQGVRVVPVFGWPLSSLDAYLTTNGATKGGAKASPISLLLALNLTIPRAQDKDWLAAHRIRVMNLIATRDSRAAWAGDVRGIPGDRVPLLVTAPERAGATEPILFATQEDVDGARASAAVPERVDAIIGRVQRWLALRAKPAADRRVAILYYNNPPGRGNIGASYLATLPSLTAILERLRTAGYRTGTHLPDTATLTRLLEANGRNVETWSPGELDAMARAGHVTLLPVSQYRKWFDELPPAFRDAVTRAWGPPERNPLMLTRAGSSDPEPAFVIPGLRFGNLFVGPQPLRSTFARAQDTSHDLLTPPPHSYIAAYLWYRHAFGADAVVHVGRHGTLEWLPGKQVGLSGDDSAEVLLGGLPNPYVYIQDGGGEAIQAKRRSAAVLVSHLSPLLANAGQPPALAQLDTAIEQEAATRDASPELAREYRAQAIAQVRELGLDKQLGLDPNAPWDTIEPTIHAFLHRVEAEPVPLGIHALGEMPPLREQEDALATMLAARFSPAQARAIGAPRLREWAAALVAGREPSLDGLEASNNDTEAAGAAIATARTWLADLRISPSRELDGLVTVLSGDYLPSGPLGDPVRTPDSLPTGRNLHAFDGAQIPTRAAWALGKTMAEQTLARYRKENGTLPESVSMVLWYGETERHQGAMEAEAMYLMGVTPVWNARGIVEDVKLIPDSELGRPRVNVVLTISGIYRDGFGDKVALLDKAARLAAAAGDNAISRHDRAVKDALIAQGADADKASRLARARVFAAAPGSYAIGVQQMVEQSRDVQPPAGDAQPGTHGNRNALAELYLHAMNHAYSAEGWGDTGPAALASHLRGNQAVLFSRTSTLYGALDNDDTYQYAGGLVAATRAVTGQAPPLWLHNLRTAGDARTVDARTWLATELNARQWNPKWIVAMQRSGYAGAREIQREVEHLYGFQATVPEQMSGTFWQRTYDVYVADSLRLGMDRFFRASNPHAMQAMLARLIEVDRQGSYRFSERERAELLRRYAASVRHDGLSCTANTCGNPVLMAHIGRTLRQARVDPATMHDVGRQFAAAMVADPRPDATTQTATQTTTQTTTQTAPMHVVRAPATPHASPAFRPTPSLPRDASSTPTPAVSTPAAPIQGIRLEPVTPAAASPSPVAAPWRLGALAFTLLAFLMGAAAAWRRTVR